jgi:CheY-like chemotaxis protein
MSPADLRIVIADDNKDAAQAFHRLLTLSGYRVVAVVYNGQDALETIDRERPDVALLDIGMPVIRGDEVAQQLRNVPSRPFLVAITGWSNRQDRQDALAAGFDEHLAKPVSWDQLQHVLSSRTTAFD